MLHQRMTGQAQHPAAPNNIHAGTSKQASFLEQLRYCLQRPTLSERCRDLTKLLSLALPSQAHLNPQHNQG